MSITSFYIKKNDLQPYYYVQVKDAYNLAINLTGATIYCTMKDMSGTVKINRQTTGISITDPTNGKFEYRWQATDTSTVGRYTLEFEVNPTSGGKFTVPAGDRAIVNVVESLDTL